MNRARFAIVAALGLVLAACGDTGNDDERADDATRTVEIDMVDNAFEPATLEVEQGETVRFLFSNTGEVAHDAFIGDADAQEEHETELRVDDDEHGGHGSDSDDAVTVEPADTAELTYTFDEAGAIEVGCHQEGHYEGGMKIEVEVA